MRHASGYAQFVEFAGENGTEASALLDLWAVAHFIRAHKAALEDDPELLRSAVIFLGNVLIANHPQCFWSGAGPELAVTSEQHVVEDETGVRLEPTERRYIRVGGTVPALLSADEARFLEFQRVVDHWRPGAPMPGTRTLTRGDRPE